MLSLSKHAWRRSGYAVIVLHRKAAGEALVWTGGKRADSAWFICF